jgi:hypothetical protein
MHLVQLDASNVVRDVVDVPPGTAYPARGYVAAPDAVGLLWKLVGATWTDTPEAAALRTQAAADAATDATRQASRDREARIFSAVVAQLEADGLTWPMATARLLVDTIQRVPAGSRTPREQRFMQIVAAAAAANP